MTIRGKIDAFTNEIIRVFGTRPASITVRQQREAKMAFELRRFGKTRIKRGQ